MWWEPTDDDERRVEEAIHALTELFPEFAPDRMIGVGSFFGPQQITPLVLINQRSTDYRGPTPVVLERPPEWLLSPLGDQYFLDELTSLVVPEPEPLAGSFSSISSGKSIFEASSTERGTVGPLVDIHDDDSVRSGFLTAGHCLPSGSGATIEMEEKRLMGMTSVKTRVGHTVLQKDPASTSRKAGYDVAVVELSPGISTCSVRLSKVQSVNAPIHSLHPCDLYAGGPNRVRRSALAGTLNVFGNQRRYWKNSWILQPPSVASKGDSGSLVTVHGQPYGVAILVGGSRLGGHAGFSQLYAQDLASIHRDILNPNNVTLT